ncbi:MAG: hypothetical protein ABIE22_04640 [archaeon]
MKKRALFAVLILFALLSANFVLAAQGDARKTIKESVLDPIVSELEPILRWVLNDLNGDSNIFFAKVLFFLLVLSVVWLVADNIPVIGDNAFVAGLTAFVVAVLGARFISDIWVKALVLPYQSAFLIIAALIPFILIFFFIEVVFQGTQYRTIRRIMWVFAAVVFFAMYLSTPITVADAPAAPTRGGSAPINVAVTAAAVTDVLSAPENIFMLAAIACLIMLFLDKTIQKAFTQIKSENRTSIAKNKIVAQSHEDMIDLHDKLSKGAVTQVEHDKEVKRLQKLIKDMS